MIFQKYLLVMIPALWIFELVSVVSCATAAAYQPPNPQIDLLEGMLYEGVAEGGQKLTRVLNQCKHSTPVGDTSPAQWVRFAFHDVATHNAADGTGGMDASLVFELDRSENKGGTLGNVIIDLSNFANQYISRSDIFALGCVLAVAECGGPIIPYRGGRVDALSAGPTGVPEPGQDIESHIGAFKRMGFTQSEMISLIACGHTVGGVTSADFPDIVPPSPRPGAPITAPFDTSVGFDNTGVLQYLNGTTLNPLVVASNTTFRSDLRIFSSDNNATMKGLVASPDAFTKTCGSLLERMINLVPKTVQLTEVITFNPAKVTYAQLGVGSDGLVLKVSFRLKDNNDEQAVKMYWNDRVGTTCANRACSVTPSNKTDITSTIISRLGLSVRKLTFYAPINPSSSISSFWFEVEEAGKRTVVFDNGGSGYPILQDVIFLQLDKSSEKRNQPSGFEIVAAVRNDKTPTRVFADWFNRADVNNLPVQQTAELVLDSSIPPLQGYSFYKTFILGAHFSFDLTAVVDGRTYTEEGRETNFIH